MMIDPRTARVKQAEREILALLREHEPSEARDEQLATTVDAYKEALSEAPEPPPEPTPEQRALLAVADQLEQRAATAITKAALREAEALLPEDPTPEQLKEVAEQVRARAAETPPA